VASQTARKNYRCRPNSTRQSHPADAAAAAAAAVKKHVFYMGVGTGEMLFVAYFVHNEGSACIASK